jgi:hypothetical protein
LATPKTFSVIPTSPNGLNSYSIYFPVPGLSNVLTIGKNCLFRVALVSGNCNMYLGNNLTPAVATFGQAPAWLPYGIALVPGAEIFDSGQNTELFLDLTQGSGFLTITPLSRS